MNRQERTVGKMCPRGCYRRIGLYPPTSKIDGVKICPDCYVEELIGTLK